MYIEIYFKFLLFLNLCVVFQLFKKVFNDHIDYSFFIYLGKKSHDSRISEYTLLCWQKYTSLMIELSCYGVSIWISIAVKRNNDHGISYKVKHLSEAAAYIFRCLVHYHYGVTW